MARLDVHADDPAGGGNPAKPHSLQNPATSSRRTAAPPWASPAGGAKPRATCAATLGEPCLLAASEPWLGPLPGARGISRLSRAVAFSRVGRGGAPFPHQAPPAITEWRRPFFRARPQPEGSEVAAGHTLQHQRGRAAGCATRRCRRSPV